MYLHIMASRRISTPQDLGAAVRDARTAAQLTQAELAERAGVSREWIIGLERGTRPRAELTKILGVLAALDQPLMLGREDHKEAQDEDEWSGSDGTPMTTAEVTRRAIEQSRRQWGAEVPGAQAAAYALAAGKTVSALDPDRSAAFVPKSDLSALLPQGTLSSILAGINFAAALPKPDLSTLLPKVDYSALMPQPSPALALLVSELGAARGPGQDRAMGDDDRDDVDSGAIAESDAGESTSADSADASDAPGSQDELR